MREPDKQITHKGVAGHGRFAHLWRDFIISLTAVRFLFPVGLHMKDLVFIPPAFALTARWLLLLLLAGLKPGLYPAELSAQSLAPPEFSHESGLYREPILLELTHTDTGVSIYYRIGAELPEPVAEQRYTTALEVGDRSAEPNYWSTIPTNTTDGSYFGFLAPRQPVPKATVVRAMAVDADGNRSDVITHTFWIHPDESFRFYTPVISVVATYDDFFSAERGIYVPGVHGEAGNILRGNFEMRGEEWERPGVFTMIDSSGVHLHTQQVGYRIHGGWSRHFPSKSLRIYARNAYENRIMPVELFPGEGVQPYRRFILRASGNDQGLAMLRDPLAQYLVRHLSFDTQVYQPAVVYLNGEYWGIKNIRDRYTRHFLERVHGVNPDAVSILEKDAEVKEGSNSHYLEMREYAVHMDLSDPEPFAWMAERMDMQNFIEYTAAQIVLANNDWPHNNIDFWRYDGPPGDGLRDGRWRWLMFDMDRSHGLGSNVNTDMIAWLLRERDNNGDEWPNLLFRNLIVNEDFRDALINAILDLLNTTFQPDYVVQALDSLAAVIEPEIPRHVQRWQRPVSPVAWHNTLFAMRNYAAERPSRVLNQLDRHFDTGELVTIRVYAASEGGTTYLNYTSLGVDRPGVVLEEGWWTGMYSEVIPVWLEARPMPGYRFDYWEVTDEGSGETTQIAEVRVRRTVREGETYRAVFSEQTESGEELDPAVLLDEPYVMTFWPESADELDDSERLQFVYMDQPDPLITATIAGFTNGDFDHSSRTRVVSLGEDGLAFINTSNLEGNPGFPGRRLGGAILPVDTRGKSSVAIDWTAGTVYSNSRIYYLRLQYRIGSGGAFQDVTDASGQPIEYQPSDQNGHRQVMPRAYLPREALGQPYVELFWRYYHTGEQVDEDSGQRSKLALHHINVHPGTTGLEDNELPVSLSLHAFPNPFNTQTTIEVQTETERDVRLEVYDMMGRRVAVLYEGTLQTGSRSFIWDAASSASGVYMVVAESGGEMWQTLVTLLK